MLFNQVSYKKKKKNVHLKTHYVGDKSTNTNMYTYL